MPQSTKASIVIRPLETRDFPAVADLARRIWLAHYATIITREQIEYMLGDRFTPQNLQAYLARDTRWMDVMERQDVLAGYCSYARTPLAHELKLEQLYLLPELHGRGLGRRMLVHVEDQARRLGCSSIMLQVNKRNDKAIRTYRRADYQVREEIVVDIGRGFVMDDYVMAKRLTA